MSALVTHNGIEKGRWFSFLSDNGDDGGENATSSCLGRLQQLGKGGEGRGGEGRRQKGKRGRGGEGKKLHVVK